MRFYLDHVGVLLDGQAMAATAIGVDQALRIGKTYEITARVQPPAEGVKSDAISFSLYWENEPDGFEFVYEVDTTFSESDVDVTPRPFPEQKRFYVAFEAKGNFKFPTDAFDLATFTVMIEEIDNVFVISLSIKEV